MEEERATELAAIDKVRDALVERGLLAPDADVEEQVVALHRYLRLTPSRMLGVALADLVGDRRIINQPGTSDEYPNWRLPLTGPDGAPAPAGDACSPTSARSGSPPSCRAATEPRSPGRGSRPPQSRRKDRRARHRILWGELTSRPMQAESGRSGVF